MRIRCENREGSRGISILLRARAMFLGVKVQEARRINAQPSQTLAVGVPPATTPGKTLVSFIALDGSTVQVSVLHLSKTEMHWFGISHALELQISRKRSRVSLIFFLSQRHRPTSNTLWSTFSQLRAPRRCCTRLPTRR